MSHEAAPVVRILAFSDLHRDTDAADAIVRASVDADVIVGAGDFATRGEGGTALLARFADLSCPFVLVAGNHDRRAELALYCADRPNTHLPDRTVASVTGLAFFGLGDAIPPNGDAPWNETMEEGVARGALRAAPDFDVLVTHSPPHGGPCDVQADGTHDGSLAVSEAI